MKAKKFAKEFIDNLNMLPKINFETNNILFNNETYTNDPDLKILRQELNKIGYDLTLLIENPKPANQAWRLTKLK